MGLLSGLLGNASEADIGKVEKEIGELLVEGERVDAAFQLIRDLIIFTSKRLITIDKQGMTGKKREITTIPYKSITRFSKETAGHLDLDSELKIWQSGNETAPREFTFKRGKAINDVYRLLSHYVL